MSFNGKFGNTTGVGGLDDYFLFQKFKYFIADEEIGIDINLLIAIKYEVDVDGKKRRRYALMDKLITGLEGKEFKFVDFCGIGAGNPASQLIN